MMIPFNAIYSIARDRDTEIRQAANREYGQKTHLSQRGRTIAALLQRLPGNSPAPAGAPWAQETEPGR